MKQCKCPNCSACIEIDEKMEVNKCSFCGTSFVTESVITPTTNNQASVINYYINSSNSDFPITNTNKSTRPEINWGLAVILLFLYVFPGLIYIGSVKNAQREWDEKHKHKNN